jgi:hypothetical protein
MYLITLNITDDQPSVAAKEENDVVYLALR